MINILILCFLIMCLYSAKFKRKGFYDDNLSIENTNMMKGIFCISIMLCHLSEMPEVNHLYFFRGTGNLGVSMFLFLSGYGLMSSYRKNGIKNFISKRFSAAFVPFLIAEVISYFAFYFLPGVQGIEQEDYNIRTLFEKFINSGSTLIINGWYIFEILLLYLLFFVAFKFSKSKKQGLISISFLTILTTVLFAVLTHETDWIQFWAYSTMSFLYGILWSEYKEKIESFFKKRYYFFLMLFISLTTLCFFSNYIFDKIEFFALNNINTTFLSRYLTSPFFIIVVVLVSMKLKGNSEILGFLGKISYEIYLYHGLIYCFLRSDYAFIKNDLLYCGVTVALSIDFAYMMNYFTAYIKELPSKIKARRIKKRLT